MRNQRVLEFFVGCFMLAGIIAILFLALKVSGLTGTWNNSGYEVHATFTNIGGLKDRASVNVAGVKVGYVKSIQLDPETYRADVTLEIDKNVKDLPIDTSASILTQGLLGSNYIGLTPGYDARMLTNGGTITTTHSALILENLIGQFMYKIGGSK